MLVTPCERIFDVLFSRQRKVIFTTDILKIKLNAALIFFPRLCTSLSLCVTFWQLSYPIIQTLLGSLDDTECCSKSLLILLSCWSMWKSFYVINWQWVSSYFWMDCFSLWKFFKHLKIKLNKWFHKTHPVKISTCYKMLQNETEFIR